MLFVLAVTGSSLAAAAAIPYLPAGSMPVASLPPTQQASDWLAETRRRLAQQDTAGALEIVERHLTAHPKDLEARGWRGRILSWLGRWAEAEADFRRVLEDVPDDVDILIGLSNVLAWQKRYQEALELLDRAQSAAGGKPQQVEALNARGRVLRDLGRREEARQSFREALGIQPENAEARRGLESLAEAPRHRLEVGAGYDFFNFTSQDAQSYYLLLRSELGSRWTSVLGTQFDRRFGEQAGRFQGSLSYRLGRRDWLTVGGGVARDQGIVPKGEASAEYGHAFTISQHGFLRGLEVSYQQRWLWFESARVLIFTPAFIAYFPRNWMWSLSVSAARNRIPGAGVEWQPAGSTKLTFPLHRRVMGNVFYGVGAENFALADQIGRFSARTYGGGARMELNRRQDVSFYFAWQDRSRSQRQASFGVSYGFRF
jgi:YaiO family outer membrane protein